MTGPILERRDAARPSGPATLANGAEKRTWFGRLLRLFLEPIYYWLNLKGPDGRPSYSKVMGTISFVFGMGLLFRLWSHYFAEAETVGHAHPGMGELGFLLGFSSLVFGLPYGLKWLTTWSATQGMAAQATLHMASQHEAARIDAQANLEKVRADIADRRRAAGGDYEATP